MNQDYWNGIWQQLTGKAKELRGRLTHSPLLEAAGIREQLSGRIQAQRGATQAQATRQLKDFLQRNRNWYLSNR